MFIKQITQGEEMKKLINLPVLFICLFFSTFSFSADITEADVKGLIAELDAAIVNQDANRIGKLLSDDIKITMNIKAQGQTQVLKPSKRDYIQMTKEGWAVSSNYKYKRLKLNINIRDNVAYATATIIESMTIAGQKIGGQTKEMATIKMINGKPLVTKLVGHTKM